MHCSMPRVFMSKGVNRMENSVYERAVGESRLVARSGSPQLLAQATGLRPFWSFNRLKLPSANGLGSPAPLA
jgi:hypothetical protein